jgi:DNA-binding transcriptional LysR family regulator
MNQSALEGFVKIVEMDSFSAAAEALYLSQSALSQQIRTLDKRRLRERAGVIPPDDMRRVDEALGVSMGLESQDVHTNTGYF